MNGRTAKKLRKIARKDEKVVIMNMMNSIKTWTLGERFWFAWKCITKSYQVRK